MTKKLFVGIVIFSLVLVCGSKLLKANIGIKAGMSMVNVTLSQDFPDTEFNSRNEFVVGAFCSINLFKTLAVQPEVYYLTKGVNLTEVDESMVTEMKFSYIEIPVLIKYQVPVKGNIKPGIFAGPYFAFFLSAREIETKNGVTSETDIDDFGKKMDYGLVFGGCLEYKLGFGKLILDIRYNLGLVNAVKHLRIMTSGVMNDDDFIKNRSFIIMVGFGF